MVSELWIWIGRIRIFRKLLFRNILTNNCVKTKTSCREKHEHTFPKESLASALLFRFLFYFCLVLESDTKLSKRPDPQNLSVYRVWEGFLGWLFHVWCFFAWPFLPYCCFLQYLHEKSPYLYVHCTVYMQDLWNIAYLQVYLVNQGDVESWTAVGVK